MEVRITDHADENSIGFFLGQYAAPDHWLRESMKAAAYKTLIEDGILGIYEHPDKNWGVDLIKDRDTYSLYVHKRADYEIPWKEFEKHVAETRKALGKMRLQEKSSMPVPRAGARLRRSWEGAPE